MVPAAARRARAIITVSQFSAGEIVRTLGVSPSKVFSIYNGYNSGEFYPETLERVRAFKETTGPYLLCVGGKGAHKNQEALVRAFGIFRQRTGLAYRLVLVGNPGLGYEGLVREIEASPYRDDILDKAFVPDAELRLLYSAADMLVFPSLYEGFGIPAIEAMACGCPVIASDRGSLPEIVGDAGVLVDCTEAETLAEAIRALTLDPARREELVQRGLQRCRSFSWTTAAAQTLSVYRKVLETRDAEEDRT